MSTIKIQFKKILSTIPDLNHNQRVIIKDAVDHLVKKAGNLSDDEKFVVNFTSEQYLKKKKIPTVLMQEITRSESEAYNGWEKARKEKDFSIFAPHSLRLQPNIKG